MNRHSFDTDRIVQMYKSGQSSPAIADIIGCSKSFVLLTLKRNNVPRRTTKWGKRDDAIVSEYVSGKSENAVSKKFGISRSAVRRRLEKAGVHIRNQSESEALKWAKMTKKQRANQVRKAHKSTANRSAKRLKEIQRMSAKTKQKSLSKVGELEMEFIKAFEKRGLTCKPQLAVDVYNIDIAVGNTAIEIHGNSSNPHTHKGFYKRRIVNLLKRGWNVIYIKTIGDVFVDRTADKVCAMIDLIKSDKSGICHYGMIRGSGELVATGCLDGDNIATVETTHGLFATIE